MTDLAAAPCEACPLCVTRAVASRGPVPARILMLSGAPRHHEEHHGVAFASPAFSWLESTLARAGIDPATVHYATLIGCRPPHQRPMRPEEIDACAPRLNRTIDAVSPDVIVLCGSDAMSAMLPDETLVAKGQIVVRGGRRILPIRHPYSTLHCSAFVDSLEEDLRRLAELLMLDHTEAADVVDADAAITGDEGTVEHREFQPAVEEYAPSMGPMPVICDPTTPGSIEESTLDGPVTKESDGEAAPLERDEGHDDGTPASPPVIDEALPEEPEGPSQLSLF